MKWIFKNSPLRRNFSDFKSHLFLPLLSIPSLPSTSWGLFEAAKGWGFLFTTYLQAEWASDLFKDPWSSSACQPRKGYGCKQALHCRGPWTITPLPPPNPRTRLISRWQGCPCGKFLLEIFTRCAWQWVMGSFLLLFNEKRNYCNWLHAGKALLSHWIVIIFLNCYVEYSNIFKWLRKQSAYI